MLERRRGPTVHPSFQFYVQEGLKGVRAFTFHPSLSLYVGKSGGGGGQHWGGGIQVEKRGVRREEREGGRGGQAKELD